MQIGKNAHPLFRRNLRKKTLRDSVISSDFIRPIGGVSYYINDEELETRVYIQNYFALLADSDDVRARWFVDVYSSEGEKMIRKEGEFSGAQGAVIEISKLHDVGCSGVLHAGVYLRDETFIIDKPLLSVFFVEFSQKNKKAQRKVISHSLGFPTASIYTYERCSSGIFLPPDSRPYLLVANGTMLSPESSMSAAGGNLQITNDAGAMIEMVLPDMKKSLSSRKLDLFALCPELRAHVGESPFSIKIKGKNILGKPFLLIAGDQVLLGDHL